MIRKPTMKILNYATKFCSFLLKIGKVFIVLFDVNTSERVRFSLPFILLS